MYWLGRGSRIGGRGEENERVYRESYLSVPCSIMLPPRSVSGEGLGRFRRVGPSLLGVHSFRGGDEMVRKVKGGYVVLSHKGKRLSKRYASYSAAVKRLRQIEWFKHHR